MYLTFQHLSYGGFAMAHLVFDQAGDLPVTYYLNDTSVGAGGNNRDRADVQLVQFFLRQFYLSHPDLFVGLPQTKIPGVSVDIDGKVGGQTIEGIRAFQNYKKNIGNPMFVDGRVSIALGRMIQGTGNIYTIYSLNDDFFFLKDTYNQWMGKLHIHPDIVAKAPELQAELALLETTGDAD
jgi:hypothetical protein